jgi:hypothetical protein
VLSELAVAHADHVDAGDLDVHASGGRSTADRNVPLATRRQRVDAEARRLADLGATITGALSADGLDHYAMGMKDPEGNEFDIN